MDEIFGTKFEAHMICALVETTPEVDHVDFNNRATIVFFKDGTKSVSKCSECLASTGLERPLCVCGNRDPQKDDGCKTFGYSKEKGLITALAKRHRPDLFDLIEEWC